MDDLLFKAIDLSGELAVLVGSARGLRDASAWFTKKENPPTESASASANGDQSNSSTNAEGLRRSRNYIVYDEKQATLARQRAIKDRAVPPQFPQWIGL